MRFATTVLLGLVLIACAAKGGGPAAPGGTAPAPGGGGWYCVVFVQEGERMSECTRTLEACQADEAGSQVVEPCRAHDRVYCYTLADDPTPVCTPTRDECLLESPDCVER